MESFHRPAQATKKSAAWFIKRAFCAALVCALLDFAGHARAKDVAARPRRLGHLTNSSDATGSSSSEKSVDDASCGSLDEDSEDYDAEQWLAICNALRPEKLQPYYLMPVMMGGKLLATLYIFGFDLKFKPPPQDSVPEKIKRVLTEIAKVLGSVFFLAMAINGYYHDFLDFQHSKITGFWRSCGVMMIIWATSPNYVAALTIWSSFSFQSPTSLLQMKSPKYIDIPFAYGVPLIPGTAKWLPPLKHIYAFVLFPYFIPKYVGGLSINFAYCAWCCVTRCGPLCGAVKAGCCCGCSLFGVIFTFGLWGAAKSTLAETWAHIWPIYYMLMMQLWAAVIAPLIMAVLYGVVICAGCEGIIQGLAQATLPDMEASNNPLEAQQAANIAISPEDNQMLRKINVEQLQQDFKDAPQENELESLRGQSDEVAKSLLDTKVVIFYKTLQSMSEVILFQIGWLTLVRMFTSKTYEGYSLAVYVTVQERHASTWFAGLMEIGTAKTSMALNIFWRFLG